MATDPFERAGEVPEDVLRLAEAFVFASPDVDLPSGFQFDPKRFSVAGRLRP